MTASRSSGATADESRHPGAVLRALTLLALAAGALVLVLYGLFALLYNGDGGDTYVTIFGTDVDANLVGAVSLALAALLAALAAKALRWPRRESSRLP